MPRPRLTTPKPWARGVSIARQNRATSLFVRGNAFFIKRDFARALGFYRKAIQAWDHPRIRYNMAVALIELKRPVEAGRSLLQALRFGQGPLPRDRYLQALTYKRLLFGQAVQLRVECDEPGATVTLDKRTLFTGPGSATRVVRPGTHVVTASKPGYVSTTQRITFGAGRATVIKLDLVRMPPTRTWIRWLPWTLLGLGIGMAAAISTPLLLQARADFRRLKNQIDQLDPGDAAVPLDASLVRRGRRMEAAGWAVLGLGAAIAITGASLLALRRPKRERPAPFSFRPSVSPAGIALTLGGAF